MREGESVVIPRLGRGLITVTIPVSVSIVRDGAKPSRFRTVTG
jgi:hypothetical protein